MTASYIYVLYNDSRAHNINIILARKIAWPYRIRGPGRRRQNPVSLPSSFSILLFMVASCSFDEDIGVSCINSVRQAILFIESLTLYQFDLRCKKTAKPRLARVFIRPIQRVGQPVTLFEFIALSCVFDYIYFFRYSCEVDTWRIVNSSQGIDRFL